MIRESVVVLPPSPCQALKEDFPLSHVISPFTNQERREGMLLNLLIPFVLTVGSGSKGKEQTNSKSVGIERPLFSTIWVSGDKFSSPSIRLEFVLFCNKL